MRMDQCAAVTNARKDIGIMRVPLEVSLGVRQSRALRARAALAQKQVAKHEVQHVSDARLQAPNHGFTSLGPAPAQDMCPTGEIPGCMVPLLVRELALGDESGPCSEAAAAALPDSALPGAPPAVAASSAPCSDGHKALRGRHSCRRAARRAEPCTEEGALIEASLPVLRGSTAPCDEAVTCAPGRLKRVPGGDPLQVHPFLLF